MFVCCCCTVLKAFAYQAVSQMSLSNAKAALVGAKSHLTQSGFLSLSAFNIPKQDAIASRVQGNIRHFWSAYGAIFGLVALYSVFTSPLLLCSIFIVFSMYMYLFKVNAGRVVRFGEHTCDASQKVGFFGVLSLIIFVFSGFLSHVLSVALWGSGIVLVHAALHKPVATNMIDGTREMVPQQVEGTKLPM